MNRRGFLSVLACAAAAPAVVRAESLMKIWVPPTDIIAERTGSGMMLIQQELQRQYSRALRQMTDDVSRQLIGLYAKFLDENPGLI